MRQTALQKHMSAIGRKGGNATAKKGSEHYRELARKRWKKTKTAQSTSTTKKTKQRAKTGA